MNNLKFTHLSEVTDIPQSFQQGFGENTGEDKTIRLKLHTTSHETAYVELTREGAMELMQRIKEQMG